MKSKIGCGGAAIILMIIGSAMVIVNAGKSSDSTTKTTKSYIVSTTHETETVSTTATTTRETTTENPYELGDYEVNIKSANLCNDSNGDPVLVVNIDFTNNSGSAESYGSAITDIAYQNGVELDEYYLWMDESTYDISTRSRDVLPGYTYSVQAAFKLNDRTNPVIVRCSESWAFTGKKVQKTFNIT